MYLKFKKVAYPVYIENEKKLKKIFLNKSTHNTHNLIKLLIIKF